jgi:hypothetical protein
MIIYPEDGYNLQIGFRHASLWKQETVDMDVTVLQSCLAEDVEGKEIYEGFVIENIKTKSRYVVEDMIEFHLWCQRNSVNASISHKIIGNIYENDSLNEHTEPEHTLNNITVKNSNMWFTYDKQHQIGSYLGLKGYDYVEVTHIDNFMKPLFRGPSIQSCLDYLNSK